MTIESNPNAILIYPNTVLREKTRELSDEEIRSARVLELAKNMQRLMYKADGVGLAAPQIGQSIRMTVIDAQDGSGQFVLLNPKIISRSFRNTSLEEGCLSIPNVYAPVKRSRFVTIEYYDLTGNKQKLQAPEFLSRVIQHELDHLDGVLFIDRAATITHGQDLLDEWNNGKTPLLQLPYPYTY